MIISHIVACSSDGVIGANGKMPWHIPEDLRHFKKTTQNHPVIMGRKTYESIGRPLPQRYNLVVSRQRDLKIEGVEVVHSLSEALDKCESQKARWGNEVFIIGGGEIYRQSMPITQRVYLTQIDASVDGDTTYPNLSDYGFQKVASKPGTSESNWHYRFEIWERPLPASTD